MNHVVLSISYKRLYCLLFFIVLMITSLLTGSAAAEEADLRIAREEGYVLKPNDVLGLSVYGEEDLSVQTKILMTGEAVFPLIGAVPVNGLSLRTATQRVRDLYAADYLVDPKVSLTVLEYAVQHVSVLGAVNAPGQVVMPASGALDMAAALAAAGGLAPIADPNRISLVRSSGARSEYSLTTIEKGGSIKLGAGDRLIVATSRFLNQNVVFVGEVRKQGSVDFPLDGKLDLVSAVARAGGFTELANPRKVAVNRGGKITVLDVRQMTEKGSEPFILLPGDIITVPERLF